MANNHKNNYNIMAPATLGDNATLKRPREIQIPSFDARAIVGNLQKALTSKQRILAVHQIRGVIDSSSSNNSSQVIRWLVDEGIFRVVHLQLRFVLQRHGSVKQEVQVLASLLVSLLRGCEPSAFQTEILGDQGENEIVNIVDTVSRLYAWKLYAEMAAILQLVSSNVDGTKAILRCRSAVYRMVDVLKNSSTEVGILVETLAVFKNISLHADEDRGLLLEIPDLVFSLTSLDQGQDKLSAIWRNLSMSIGIRHRLCHDAHILNSLLSFAESKSSYVVRNLLNTIISISMESDSCLLLVCHGDGLFVKEMQRLIGHSDPVVRKRAARVFKLWSSNDISGPVLIHYPHLMDLLSSRTMNDPDSHVRQEAGDAFCRCSQLIQSPMPQHKAVLDSLLRIARNSSFPVDVMARALRAQASHKENRIPMAERAMFISLLAYVATTHISTTAKEDACCALADLALEPQNLDRLSIPPVLDAIVSNTLSGFGACRDFAVVCFVRLALFKDSNRIRFSTRADLLQSLLLYAATSAQMETKAQVKKVILLLISEI